MPSTPDKTLDVDIAIICVFNCLGHCSVLATITNLFDGPCLCISREGFQPLLHRVLLLHFLHEFLLVDLLVANWLWLQKRGSSIFQNILGVMDPVLKRGEELESGNFPFLCWLDLLFILRVHIVHRARDQVACEVDPDQLAF